jgi:hypothetical protein
VKQLISARKLWLDDMFLMNSIRCFQINFQEKQIVLLLNKGLPSGQAWLMILQIEDLFYIELTETPLCRASLLNLCLSKVSGNSLLLVSLMGADLHNIFFYYLAGCYC